MKVEVVASPNESPYVFNHSMTDQRYRQSGSGRRSPTFNPARASLPVNVGYNPMYGAELHAVPTGRYDAAVPRDHHHHRPATKTITTYNVTKEPVVRSASTREPSRTRHRSATIDTGSVKPIIVTTNHSRPHNTSSHASSATSRRPESPRRDPYRSSEEAYYAQPASSIRSRSHQRTHSAVYEQDAIYRMRERLGGDDRLRAPARPHSRQSMYVNPPRASATDFAEDYEYTKPSDLARYDLDHDRPRSRAGRRDSFDRGANYYRPTVNVTTNDIGGRPERRAPPTSGALDRYNRGAAVGAYERGSVPMNAVAILPAAAPPVDPRRSMLDAPTDPSSDRRTSRPRPISLYQDPAPRMDELAYRPREENLPKDLRNRDRDEPFRDEAITTRGFGIRPELLDQVDHRRPLEPERSERRDIDDHRPRREYEPREPKRRSDEELDKSRGRHERRPSEVRDRPARLEESRDRKDGKGEKIRDKVVAGLGVAAAAIGLGGAAKENQRDEKEGRVSPRRREDPEFVDQEPIGSRAADRYKPREADMDRRASPRQDPIVVEQRREGAKDRFDRRDDSISPVSRDRERERERERDRDREREREKDRQREKEREREREKEAERERDRSRRDADIRTTGGKADTREDSPYSDDAAAGPSRRRPRSSAAFDPTDTKGLMDLKAELAAIDHEKPREKERPDVRDRSDKASTESVGPERHSARDRERERDRDHEQALDRARDESRGRELALIEAEQKQVRVVSPPRDKSDQKPIKGILKQPTSQFPDHPNSIREGVAPHKDDKTKKDVPSGARWTKINRRMVNPEALTIGKERFEVRDDFVIVLRVLSKEEIQAYATATAQLREMRRKEYERDHGDRDSDRGRDRDDDEHKRRHRHHRDRDEDDAKDRDSDRDRDRDHSRRHKRDAEEDKPRALEYDDHSRQHHHRSHRDRDLETIASSNDDRR